MTFCPDDQTNPSLRVVFCARKFLSFFERDKKMRLRFQGQMRKKKSDHTCDTWFSVKVFGVLYSGAFKWWFFGTHLSAMMRRE